MLQNAWPSEQPQQPQQADVTLKADARRPGLAQVPCQSTE